jgi:hypothetical protein
MTIEVSKGDGPYWCLEIDGRIVSFGLNWDEAQHLASEWRGEQCNWTPSWRFARPN